MGSKDDSVLFLKIKTFQCTRIIGYICNIRNTKILPVHPEDQNYSSLAYDHPHLPYKELLHIQPLDPQGLNYAETG